ncbi:Holliday junction branch migration protein RuvA [Helicobacter muridarum]|uniref:Holliday junction branch migration complex subunit RuvA n=1 Tax=Helicobacter muridarum TaxID=216 RepID=A0A099TYI5_9HELI|nr:Holliday junction branch migration protein RuvA [Helicobacter muridarum]TLE00753.1 Holliday junction branch migration protein RuvA [Helicobacter muridarum]STQ86567.1 Holliday junction DNA helicase [Helicobacter muridarum]
MIIRLKGNIERLLPTSVELEVHGITYFIELPLTVSNEIQNKSNITLEIAQIIRDDSNYLYGFTSKEARDIFLRLLKVNGVGAKSGLAILSNYSANDFLEIIATNNITAIKNVKGIGAKIAGKIMLELSGYTQNLQKLEQNSNMQLIYDSLINLGFKEIEIHNSLKKLDSEILKMPINDAIKAILKTMSKH